MRVTLLLALLFSSACRFGPSASPEPDQGAEAEVPISPTSIPTPKPEPPREAPVPKLDAHDLEACLLELDRARQSEDWLLEELQRAGQPGSACDVEIDYE